jgi:hypothetical protein
MSTRPWTLFAAAVLALSTGAQAQNYQELSAMATGPWHHVPVGRGPLEFNREMAKCQVVSAQTPVSSTTPAVVEIVHWRVLINCLKASGWEPGAKGSAVARHSAPAKVKLSDIKAAGGGVGIFPCSELTKALENPNMEAVFFTWAQGFLTGWNLGTPDETGLSVDMSGLDRDEQKQFMRDYCEANPTKRYLEGVIALMSRLRTAKKTTP